MGLLLLSKFRYSVLLFSLLTRILMLISVLAFVGRTATLGL